MRTRTVAVLGLLALAACLLAPVPARADGETFLDAVRSGTPNFGFRLRWESVDDDAFADDGEALTVRLNLGYRTGEWRGLSFYAEVQSVQDLAKADSHNDKGAGEHWNGVSTYPVIADPSITDFYQAYLNLRLGEQTTVRAGRQEIKLDNVRFVGNVGWRQFHQSFDAIRVDTSAIPHTKLTYIYVAKVHRIFGDGLPMSSHLLNASWKLTGASTLHAYAYRVDYDRAADSGLSTMTLGARWDGSVALGGAWKGLFDVEIAKQSDTGDNPNNVDQWYYRGVIGARYDAFTARIGYELLGGDGKDGVFTTPLATLHAWNGWADMFLKTPADATGRYWGLEDTFLSLGWKKNRWNLLATWHDFSADTGGVDYGTELDLLCAWTSPWKQVFALKYASFSHDDWSRDVDKLWAYTAWKF